jgi:hypothetical protein
MGLSDGRKCPSFFENSFSAGQINYGYLVRAARRFCDTVRVFVSIAASFGWLLFSLTQFHQREAAMLP